MVRIIVLLTLCQVQLHAQTLESRFLRRLMVAHSAHEVDRLRQDYEELKVARGACKIQLREQVVPSACYASVHLESRLGLYKRQAQKTELLRKLDSKCLRATQSLHLRAETPETGVSEFCFQRIREAQKIQAYQQEESSSFDND